MRPTHTLVRRRVVHHAREKLAAWGAKHATAGSFQATPQQLRDVQAVAASYQGHFSHANAWRLRAALTREFPWLPAALTRRRFHSRLDGRRLSFPTFRPR